MKSKNKGICSSIASVFVALCCAGSPLVLALVTGLGLGFLINDFILFPILFVSWGFMFYTLYNNNKTHNNLTPLIIAILSAIIILMGIFTGPIIWLGIIGLFAATMMDFIHIKDHNKLRVKK